MRPSAFDKFSVTRHSKLRLPTLTAMVAGPNKMLLTMTSRKDWSMVGPAASNPPFSESISDGMPTDRASMIANN